MHAYSEDIRPGIAFKRFTSRPFPPYRFTPGRDPHPIANPLGHSYLPPGTPHPQPAPMSPQHWQECEPYLFGCDLYNHAYWWEAHEEWEGIWKRFEKGTAPREFLQGLIQVSACHLKLYLGHMDGVERLRGTSAEHLRAAERLAGAEPLMGLSTGGFLSTVEAYISCVMQGGEGGWHDPARYPYIELRS